MEETEKKTKKKTTTKTSDSVDKPKKTTKKATKPKDDVSTEIDNPKKVSDSRRRSDSALGYSETGKKGRPFSISQDDLYMLAIEYIRDKGYRTELAKGDVEIVKHNMVTKIGFQNYLASRDYISYKSAKYWYNLSHTYDDVKQSIENLFEEHNVQAMTSGDTASNPSIFWFKNNTRYRDKIETTTTSIVQSELDSLSADELLKRLEEIDE